VTIGFVAILIVAWDCRQSQLRIDDRDLEAVGLDLTVKIAAVSISGRFPNSRDLVSLRNRYRTTRSRRRFAPWSIYRCAFRLANR